LQLHCCSCPDARHAAGRFHILKESTMSLTAHIGPVAALIAGILILLMPKLLNFIVAIYLIIVGVIGLFGTGWLRM
jgi:hypothetical protein